MRYINVIKKNNGTPPLGAIRNTSPSCEVDIAIPNTHIAGDFEHIHIRQGIKMVITNHERHRTLQMDYEVENAPISFSFNLSQSICNTMTSGRKWKRVVERFPGDAVVAYLPQTKGTNVILPHNRITGVALHFCPQTFFSLFEEQPDCLKQLHSVSNALNDIRFFHHSRIKKDTLPVLRQILECPYTGETKRLYLEAKALELVAIKLAELGKGPQRHAAHALAPRDLDRTREAHHILMARLDHPPSLYDLSRLVGINRNKLNQGFKEIYGDTVFNVLRAARLSKARTLMIQTSLSLSEIALSVGYNSQANFTTAFRKEFGTPPNTFRRNLSPRMA